MTIFINHQFYVGYLSLSNMEQGCCTDTHSGSNLWLHPMSLLRGVAIQWKDIGCCCCCDHGYALLIIVVIRQWECSTFCPPNIQVCGCFILLSGECSTFRPPKKILYHAIFSSCNGALKSFPFSLFLQPFWQVVSYQDSRGRGVVGKGCKSPLYINFFLFGGWLCLRLEFWGV
jgi:hypothetical protein